MSEKNDYRPAAAPLLSWDIFMNGYQRKVDLASDFNQLNKLSISKKWVNEWDIESKLFRQGKVIIVTDHLLRIVYSSSNVFEMNAYTSDELQGRSPKMFQGPGTSTESILKIREAINSLKPIEITVLNYKKTGQPYYCHVQEYPVFNKNRELSHFIAFENPATEPSV